MTWALLLTLAAVVFFNRYVFLEPKVAIRLPKLLERMLHYAAPCLLAAICVPIVFYDDAGAWRGAKCLCVCRRGVLRVGVVYPPRVAQHGLEFGGVLHLDVRCVLSRCFQT